MTTTDGGRELFLTIMNDGKGYPRRVAIASRLVDYTGSRGAAETRMVAEAWCRVASDGARAYEREFGVLNAPCFTVADILCAAAELAEYYENHVRETRELAQAEG